MSPLQLKIIQKAVAIRVERGEDIDHVLSSYTKLTEVERAMIKKNLVG